MTLARRIRAAGCLLVLAALAVAVGSPTSAGADAQTLTPKTTTGAVGRVVTLDGEGWSAGKPVQVQLYRAGQPPSTVGEALVDDAGALTGQFTVPQAAPGHYQLWVCQSCGSAENAPYSVVTDFTVIPTLTLPHSVTRGSTMTATGTGWPPEYGEVYLFTSKAAMADPNNAVAVRTPSTDWTFSATFDVPDLDPGDHQIYACQGCGGTLATAPLTAAASRRGDLPIVVHTGYRIVAPKATRSTLDLVPAEGVPGAIVVARGTGWPADGGLITIFADRKDVGRADAWHFIVTPTAKGRFSVRFPAPDLVVGLHTFLACQICGTKKKREATHDFVTIARPAIQIDPPAGRSGTRTTLTGTGWQPLGGEVSIFSDASQRAEPAQALTSVRPEGDGTFTVVLTVPARDAGRYLFYACQQCAGPSGFPAATTAFTIRAPSRLGLLFGLSLGALLMATAVGLTIRHVRRRRTVLSRPRFRVRPGEGRATLAGPAEPPLLPSLRLVPHRDESPTDVQLEVPR